MRPATEQLRTTDLRWVSQLVFSVLASFSLAAEAQTPASTPEGSGRPLGAVIDEYVREGLQSNLALRAQSLEVERAEAALDAARARYFPEAGLAARYSRAEGGRSIDLPLGDTLNPAYQTLNDLLEIGRAHV